MTARVVLGRASRARWLKRRRAGITATDAAVLLGYHPWRTPLATWLEKVRPVEDEEPTFAMLRGRVLEGPLAVEYERRTGHFVTKPPLLVAHPDHPLMLASLDRIADSRDATYPLELKSEHDRDRAREWWDGDVPDYYAAQVLWQLAITGLDFGVIFGDVLGRFETRTIERDLDWESEAIPRVHDWWQRHIVEGTPPPLDPMRDYVHLNRVWVPEPGVSVEADAAVMGAVRAAVDMRGKNTVAEAIVTRLRTQIRAHMTTATLLTDPDTGATVARVDRRGVLTITYKPPVDLPEGIPA